MRRSAVEVRLVYGARAIQPGTPFPVGVHILLPEGAHIYWLNPGDVGLPTRVEWRLPPGFEAGPVRWPVPSRFTDGPSVSYGYAGEVVLLATLSPPRDLRPGTSVRLAARVDWLLCRETCEPGGADVALDLPVADDTGGPGPDASLLARYEERVPREKSGWRFQFQETGEAVVLRVRGPPDVTRRMSNWFFIPEADDLLDPAAPQTWQRVGDDDVVVLLKSPRRPRAPDPLLGVLREGPGGPPASGEQFLRVSAERRE